MDFLNVDDLDPEGEASIAALISILILILEKVNIKLILWAIDWPIKALQSQSEVTVAVTAAGTEEGIQELFSIIALLLWRKMNS